MVRVSKWKIVWVFVAIFVSYAILANPAHSAGSHLNLKMGERVVVQTGSLLCPSESAVKRLTKDAQEHLNEQTWMARAASDNCVSARVSQSPATILNLDPSVFGNSFAKIRTAEGEFFWVRQSLVAKATKSQDAKRPVSTPTKRTISTPTKRPVPCSRVAWVYTMIAAEKGAELTPQQVFESRPMRSALKAGMPAAGIRQAIQNVYYDQSFDLSPGALHDAVYNACEAIRKQAR